MSWFSSIVVGLLTAAAGMIIAGSIAILSVEWYHISGREGASGYFVVVIALLGFIAGLILGLVVSRSVAAGAAPGFFKSLGISLGILLAVGGIAGGATRLLADVPPRIGGEPLMLMVEVRWPAGQTKSPAEEPGEGFLTLGSVTRLSHTLRTTERGPLWKADAHLVDGRWIAPGAVEVFTSRGVRSLDILVDTTELGGFIVPLPAHPGKRDLEWSEWLPVSMGGGVPWPADKFSYRYRVQPRSQPVRTETFGPFEIGTIASRFYEAAYEGRAVLTTAATFRIRYRGQPITIEGEPNGTEGADAVSTVPGPEPALLIHLFDPGDPGKTYLLIGGGEQVRVETIANYDTTPVLLTSDTAAFQAMRQYQPIRGQIDRLSLEQPGVYLAAQTVIDTRHISVRRFVADPNVTLIPAVPPLGLSPDERSYIRFAYAEGSEEHPVLAVTDVVGDTAYTLPVDYGRMRFSTFDDLDPRWLLHHFGWRRDPDGVDRLVERKDFVPLPWHGKLSGEGPGLAYRLEPAGEPLRDSVVDFLVKEFKAEQLPLEPYAFQHPVRIDGQVVNVAGSENFHYVSVTMDSSGSDRTLLAAIAKRFDAELATGRYDSLFGKKSRGT